MNSRETPHVPPIQQCLPIGMVGHAERKAAEFEQAEIDRKMPVLEATPTTSLALIDQVIGQAEQGVRSPRLATIDTSKDGPTGEKQDIACWECGQPLVSYCHVLMGKRLWTTIHEHCAESASRRLWPRVRREKQPAQKQYRTPYGDH